MLSSLAFICLSASFISMWIRKDPKIWGSLFAISLILGIVAGNILPLGLLFIAIWISLWFFYDRYTSSKALFALFLVVMSFGFKLHFFSGYVPLQITSKFCVGFGSPIVGLFALALVVPLAKTKKDWKKVGIGLLSGCLGISVLAAIAILSHAVHWQYKMPTFPVARLSSNFFLTAIAEEAFYRGFIQKGLSDYWGRNRFGRVTALVVSSVIFTLAHLGWSPSIDILAFVFLASLLYGGVYMLTKKVESAILTHFLLNAVHMFFFSYHAM
jgi:membrane protease YdiL (CAAX protease family)